MDLNVLQIIVTALLSSGLVGGLMTLLSKKAWSPESKNELARIGSDFAQLLLAEARTEREELRQTIQELETSLVKKDTTITRLTRVASDKDFVIQMLEDRQIEVAKKVREGQVVTFYDIFGPKTPPEFVVVFKDKTKDEKHE